MMTAIFIIGTITLMIKAYAQYRFIKTSQDEKNEQKN